MITVFVFSLAQIPRFYSYEAMFNNKLSFESLQIEYNAEYFESSNGWGVYPQLFSVGMYPDCKVEEKDVQPQDYFGYTIFYPDNVSVELKMNKNYLLGVAHYKDKFKQDFFDNIFSRNIVKFTILNI